jgi:hypothetical protein
MADRGHRAQSDSAAAEMPSAASIRQVNYRSCGRSPTTGKKRCNRRRLDQCGGNKQIRRGGGRHDARPRGKLPHLGESRLVCCKEIQCTLLSTPRRTSRCRCAGAWRRTACRRARHISAPLSAPRFSSLYCAQYQPGRRVAPQYGTIVRRDINYERGSGDF